MEVSKEFRVFLPKHFIELYHREDLSVTLVISVLKLVEFLSNFLGLFLGFLGFGLVFRDSSVFCINSTVFKENLNSLIIVVLFGKATPTATLQCLQLKTIQPPT